MRPLAIIGHDHDVAETLRRGVEEAGFRADCFDDANAALTTIRKRPFSLAILGLRNEEAFAVCREMSRLVPVITMTSDEGDDVRVRAFEAGADDCVASTLTARELGARVRNLLRRAAAEEICELEQLTVSLKEMRIRDGNVIHELSRGETEVLGLLIDHAPSPLTPTEMARLLGAKRGTVESRIKSLRRKLGPQRLVSRGQFGYELR